MLHEREGALEKALIAFFADPVAPALAGLDRFNPHESPGEGLSQGLESIPEIEAPAEDSVA